MTALALIYHDGKTYEIGQKVPMLEGHVADFVKAGLVVERGDVAELEPEETEKFTSESEELATLKESWKVDSPEMTPQQYLEKFAQGPASDLALRIVELEAEASEAA